MLSVTNITNWNASTERPVTPSPAASSSPIPLLFEASLPSLRVALTHFTLSSYERALRLPTSFSISGLARLGVKPRLCRSSWRAFAFTHPLMLPSTPREALLACPRCVLSCLRCNGHSLLLSSYLSRIGRIENPSCSVCGHSSQDIFFLILHCLATDSLRRSLFGDSVSLRPLVQALGSCPASGAPWSSAMPPSLGRGRINYNHIANDQNWWSQQQHKFENNRSRRHFV